MNSGRSYILTVALFVLAVCSSCRQELCYDHFPSVDVRFSWEQEWERDYGMHHQAAWDPSYYRYAYDEMRPSVPEWVRVVRYFDDGRVAERVFSPEGNKFEVDYDDRYTMLFYNGDTEYIVLSDVASLSDVRASATSRSRSGASLEIMKDRYNYSRTTNPPDVIYSAFVDHTPTVEIHQTTPLPVKMQPLVYTYLVTFEFEGGIELVALARGALGGMADGVYLRTGTTTDEASIILFDCEIYSDACCSKVRSFGIPSFPDSYFGRASRATGPYYLNLEVKLKSGKTMDFDFDITDQIKNQPRGGVIKVGGIVVEDDTPPQTAAGFDVDVTGWDDNVEEIDLPVGPLN